jgi:hypothetical protein
LNSLNTFGAPGGAEFLLVEPALDQPIKDKRKEDTDVQIMTS